MLKSVLCGILAVLPPCLAASSNQPVFWQDLADLDVIRVGSDYYYTASTMHYSPGAPILHSTDLINWQYISHAVPSLDWGPAYSLQSGSSAYVKGVYASSFRRRNSDGQWFWVGCIEYSRSFVYTAPSVTGPWTQLASYPNFCFYDCGLLFDDDETPYVAHGSGSINVATLSKDLKTLVSDKQVYTYTSASGVEGSRMYKIRGSYYILNTAPSTAVEYVLKASNPFGPYTQATLVNAGSPLPNGGGGRPHQGGIVDDQFGNWYYMGFCDAYPGGRVPVLAPVAFNSQGFPQLSNANSFPKSVTTPMQTQVLQQPTGVDSFAGTTLTQQWEWNHNPNTSAFTVNNGLTLRTATVTNDFFMARNTLTHRIQGPASVATITLDYSNMKAGDRAGLVMIRDTSTWVGVINQGSSKVVAVWSNLNLAQQNSKWVTTNTGSASATVTIPTTGTIRLRATANIQPGSSNTVQFSYSTDGSTYHNIGGTFTMNTAWQFFMGYRYGIFNFATQSLGGSVKVSSFAMQYS